MYVPSTGPSRGEHSVTTGTAARVSLPVPKGLLRGEGLPLCQSQGQNRDPNSQNRQKAGFTQARGTWSNVSWVAWERAECSHVTLFDPIVTQEYSRTDLGLGWEAGHDDRVCGVVRSSKKELETRPSKTQLQGLKEVRGGRPPAGKAPWTAVTFRGT